MALWAAEGVNTDAIDIDATAPTGVYFVTHGQQGHEFSYLRAGSAASRMSPANLSPLARETIQAARWLHVSGISLAISTSACDTVLAAMAWAKECQTQVSLDANLRLKLWPLARAQACLKQAISLCDVFLPSEDEVQPLMGSDEPLAVLDWAQELGARHVVLKRGVQGAVVRTGTQQFEIAGHATQAVDATGAGDCFAGNLLTRLAQGDDWPQAVRYANAAAALSVQGFGAVAPLPRPQAVLALLQKANA
jgi:2-dehydro-3-deoxygluconokinase